MGMHANGLLRACMVAWLAVSAGGAAAEPFRLIVTHLEPPLVPNSVMDLAVELGYFDREGVEVELVRVQQTPSAISALQAGEGEMANIGVDALLQLVAQGGSDLRAVTSPNKALPFLIASKSAIASPADLQGRSFGVGRVGSLDHSLSMKVLGAQGVDTSKLEILALGQPPVRAQALAAGQVDATTMSIGVWLSIPDKSALSVLVDQDAYFAAAPVVNKVNVVREGVLAARGDEVRAVLRALVKISRDFAANPDGWADAMVPFSAGADRATLGALAATFGASWSVNGGMSAEELRATQAWLYQTPDFAGLRAVELGEWVDFGPIDAVLAEVGTDASGDPAGR